MPTNTAESTIGVKLQYDASSTSTASWTDLPCIKSYPDLGGEPNMIDATTLCDSQTKNVLGVQELSGFAFVMNYNPTDYETIEALKGTKKTFRLVMNSTNAVKWTGEATCWINGGEVNGVKEMTFFTSCETAPTHEDIV